MSVLFERTSLLQECSICLENIEPLQRVRVIHPAVSGGHKFHEVCINPWLEKKRSCPYCRIDLGEIGEVAKKVVFVSVALLRGMSAQEEEFLSAAISGNRSKMEGLIETVSIQDFIKSISLIEASAQGRSEVVDLLIHDETILKEEKESAFKAALFESRSDLIKTFIDYLGIDVEKIEQLALKESKSGNLKNACNLLSLYPASPRLRLKVFCQSISSLCLPIRNESFAYFEKIILLLIIIGISRISISVFLSE